MQDCLYTMDAPTLRQHISIARVIATKFSFDRLGTAYFLNLI